MKVLILCISIYMVGVIFYPLVMGFFERRPMKYMSTEDYMVMLLWPSILPVCLMVLLVNYIVEKIGDVVEKIEKIWVSSMSSLGVRLASRLSNIIKEQDK